MPISIYSKKMRNLTHLQHQSNKNKNFVIVVVVAVAGSKAGSKTKVKVSGSALGKARVVLGTKTPAHGTRGTVTGRSDRIGVAITTSGSAATATVHATTFVIIVVPATIKPGSAITVEPVVVHVFAVSVRVVQKLMPVT